MVGRTRSRAILQRSYDEAMSALGLGVVVAWRGRTWVITDERGTLVLLTPLRHAARATWVHPEEVTAIP